MHNVWTGSLNLIQFGFKSLFITSVLWTTLNLWLRDDTENTKNPHYQRIPKIPLNIELCKACSARLHRTLYLTRNDNQTIRSPRGESPETQNQSRYFPYLVLIKITPPRLFEESRAECTLPVCEWKFRA